MSKPIIEVENLGKRYRIGGERERYLSLRDELAKKLSPAHRRSEAAKQDFWALKDVSFSVEEGEAVGIIGRNGAGKSTLLKILSQITPPTTGKITMRGRVASLLEVGTGFHPELTGRENIYLNGAVLGMTRREIARKFDEIVAFAEVDKFLDTPVKRYSSGMYVRLAFAVAAHLEPEILVVDEVLAVGDAQFQQKCLGKMGEVAKGGRTVLFVSHNMAAVRQLCPRAVLLSAGSIECAGCSDDVLRAYSASAAIGSSGVFALVAPNPDAQAFFTGAVLQNSQGRVTGFFEIGSPLVFVFYVRALAPQRELRISFIVRRSDGLNIYHCCSLDSMRLTSLPRGDLTITARIPELSLYPGEYVVDELWLATGENQALHYVRDATTFSVSVDSRVVSRRLFAHAAVVHETAEWSASCCAVPFAHDA